MNTTHSENGRSLVETLAVLVVIVLLLLAGLIGYDQALKYWKKVETVREISDIAVRYGMQPVRCAEKVSAGTECSVSMKDVAPDMERVSPYAVATADGGRVSITRSEEPSQFTVVVSGVLDDSCVAFLEGNAYELVEVKCNFASALEIPECAPGDKLLLGRDYLQKEVDATLRDEIIKDICAGDEGHVDMARFHWDNGCTGSSHAYFYTDTTGCGGCPGNLVEDNNGNCCSSANLNACGYCEDKGHCLLDVVGCAKDTEVCFEETKKCVECTKAEHCSECIDSTTGKKKDRWICSNNHCCPPGQKYINGHCTCEGGGVYCHETCCTSAQRCITRGTGDATVKTCCDDTGETGSSCATNDCCGEGLRCNNGRCCSATTFGHGETCVECLSNNGSGEEGACPTKEAPICDKSTANYHCVECLGGKVWTENADHTWSCQCPTGKFENSAGVCVDCLVNYGKGTGQCTDIKFPICDNKGETATWTCKECPPETPWNGETCGCPEDKPYYSAVKEECVKCLWDYQDTRDGACENAAKPLCDNGNKASSFTCQACPKTAPKWGTTERKCICLYNNGEKKSGTNTVAESADGACPEENPYCDKTGTKTCGECPTGFWNEVTHTCTECLSNNGSGKAGPCPTTDDPICRTSGENAWTCGPCSGNKKWTKDTTTGTWSCQCPPDKPYNKGDNMCVECLVNYGQGTGACPTEKEPICDNDGTSATWTCKECPPEAPWNGETCGCKEGTFWNTITETCTECLQDHGGTVNGGEGACETTEKPVCPKDGEYAWTCQACPGTAPVWDDENKICVCLYHNGEKNGAKGECPSDAPRCDKEGTRTCGDCPNGKVWNPETLSCVDCLYGYGSGKKGSCPTLANPRCDDEGEDATWTCGPCPCKDDMEWKIADQKCHFLPGKEDYVEDGSHCCPKDTPDYYSDEGFGECCAEDGSNSEFCCARVMGNGYEWKQVSDGVWQCVPKCPDGQWAQYEVNPDSTLGRCCSKVSSDLHASNGHCCKTDKEWYPADGSTPGTCCKKDTDSEECCATMHRGDGVEYEYLLVKELLFSSKTTAYCLPKCGACKKRKENSTSCVVDETQAVSSEECCKQQQRYVWTDGHCCPSSKPHWSENAGRCCEFVDAKGDCFENATNGRCYIGSNGQGRLLHCSDSRVISGEFCIGGTNGECGYGATNVREGEPCGCDAYIPWGSVKGLFVYDKHNKNWCTAYSGRGQNLCYMCGKDSHHKWKHVKSHNSFCRKL